MASKIVHFVGTDEGRRKTPWAEIIARGDEVWGLNEVTWKIGIGHCTRWFEIHWPAFWRDPKYREWLRTIQPPEALESGAPPIGEVGPFQARSNGAGAVYMLKAHDDIPASIAYPLTEAVEFIGRPYLTNSFCYMLALAMMEGFEEIHWHGALFEAFYEVNHEVPCMNWLIGMAEGRGIKVVVEPRSRLVYGSHLYGYQELIVSPKQLDDRSLIYSTPINVTGGLVVLKVDYIDSEISL